MQKITVKLFIVITCLLTISSRGEPPLTTKVIYDARAILKIMQIYDGDNESYISFLRSQILHNYVYLRSIADFKELSDGTKDYRDNTAAQYTYWIMSVGAEKMKINKNKDILFVIPKLNKDGIWIDQSDEFELDENGEIVEESGATVKLREIIDYEQKRMTESRYKRYKKLYDRDMLNFDE